MLFRSHDNITTPNESKAEEMLDEFPTEFYWFLLSCCYWLPELSLKTKKAIDKAIKLELINPKRFKLVCSVCKKKKIGCCIQCSKGNCQTAFHVECARSFGIYMEFNMINSDIETNEIFCDTPLRR